MDQFRRIRRKVNQYIPSPAATSGEEVGGDLRGNLPNPTVQTLTFEDGCPFVVWQNRWWFRDEETGYYYQGTLTSVDGILQWTFANSTPTLYADIFT
jgi:hypothetical protein